MNAKLKLLLVDDEPGIAEGLAVLLNAMKQPWEIVGIAEDGEQGVSLVHRLHPDVVITDIRMPIMDGLEMIRRLCEEQAACRYIILSGYADFDYARQAMKLGVRDYVTKPVDEDELAEAIRRIAREKGSARQEGASAGQEEAAPAASGEGNSFEAIRRYVTEHFAEDISLAGLSAMFFLNPYYISQLFRKKAGESYQSFVTRLRIEHAQRFLRETDLMIYEISERVGYNDTVYFSRVFEKITGVRPSEYRQQHRK